MNLQIDQERLDRELQQLATYSDTPSPAITRIVFSEVDRQSRGFVKSLCSEAGLSVHEDAVGNTFARWSGSDPDAPAVATGSHIDAIPHSGRYDGTVGVLGGLEAIRALQLSGWKPRRSLELLLFTSEEPTRFGVGCLGSRLLSGVLDESAGARLRDESGKTLDEVRAEAGFGGQLASVRLKQGHYHAFVELHIEQGPLLEKAGIPLGVVTAIAAPAALRIEIEGEGGHAGAVLMPDRRDAFLAAAELSLAVEAAAKSTGARDTVGTVGICRVFPGASNSIPNKVELSMDVRDIDGTRRDAALARIDEAAQEIAARRKVAVRKEVLNIDAPATCDPIVVEALASACDASKLPYQRMVSRAYHDSLFMSRIAPTGMLFIPCRSGYSHRPEEYASQEDIAKGVRILAQALAALAG